MFLPKTITPVAPPIKTQGIKTRLVPFLASSLRWRGAGRFIEPFMGSGATALNLAPPRALLADSNQHIIRFYQSVQRGLITAVSAREYLEREGEQLRRDGKAHYYLVRDRFNDSGDSLDFLFLNRACFNGVMRFNSKGGFNVPFCNKPERFRRHHVTRICNQIDWVTRVLADREWEFVCQDWRATLAEARADDFVYADPPYFGRHADYFNRWEEPEADELARALTSLPCGFAFSMWLKNRYRENDKVRQWFADQVLLTRKHFYHVGATEKLRNEMEEALVVSPGYVAPAVMEAQSR